MNTLGDFNLIRNWLKQSRLRNIEWYDQGIGQNAANSENLEKTEYYPFVQIAFNTAFAPIRNTFSPDLEELVFWYYAGHGLSKRAAHQLTYSSTPCLDRAKINPEYHRAADQFVKEFEGRKVKGGELCLQKVGFCDLYGLLKPWIAAVKEESMNAKGFSKRNKHLAIILDSCYSGIVAQELRGFEYQMSTKDPYFLQNNSVTIQAACGPSEGALGGYFTPCFVFLNDEKNTKLLRYLKVVWMAMNVEERYQYEALQLPSPMVVSTLSWCKQSQDVTLELPVRNFPFTLFRDPGFFKFCSIMVNRHQDYQWFARKERVLDHTSANVFMTSSTFTVLDYELTTLVTGPYAGSPKGLFLLEDPTNPNYAVCAHIHFQRGNTSNPERVNLVHHKKPPMGSVIYLYVKDYGCLSRHKILLNWQKDPVVALNLVRACRDYVETKEPGRWNNVSQWNMTFSDLGVNLSLRVKERQKQRSTWEHSYLERITGFDIPVATNN